MKRRKMMGRRAALERLAKSCRGGRLCPPQTTTAYTGATTEGRPYMPDRRGGGLHRLVRYFDDQLAGVRAIEQFVERGGRVLQSLDDIDAILELAFHPPLAQLHDGFHGARHVIRDEKAFEPRPLDNQLRQVIWAGRRLRRIVLRDQTAQRNARVEVDAAQHRVKDFAADVSKINVDAVRAMLLQAVTDRFILVINRRIKAEFFDQPAAFFRAASDADNAQTFDLADLADERADGAGGG